MNPEEDHNCTEIEYLEQISRFFVSFEENVLQCSRNLLSRSLRTDVSLVDTKKQRTIGLYFANNRIEHKDNDVESPHFSNKNTQQKTQCAIKFLQGNNKKIIKIEFPQSGESYLTCS